MTDTTRTFRLFSAETGHDFGVWTGTDAVGAIRAMADQAGADVDASAIEVVELTDDGYDVRFV